ncbi:MAG: hypothetical protein HS111_07255 [Kofleriaceae bacterium]|nr:hypothetical protein [Kofleriaceae bacterium]
MTGVRGLHAWVRPGDRCAVDAGHAGAPATVWVNPPATAIERARARRA